MKLFIYLTSCLFLTAIGAQEIVVRTPDGQYNVVDVESEMNFSNTIDLLQYDLNYNGEYIIDFMAITPKRNVQTKSMKGVVRDYWIPVTASEKKDVAYIINTLGMSSLLKLNGEKSSIKKAGKRLDHLHPLRFLMCIFTDDEMIASMHAMDGRTWVWSEFKSGTVTTLETEADKNNLNPDQIEHFAAQIGISAGPILTLLANRQWDNFISHLLANVKRNADAGRYNMSVQ